MFDWLISDPNGFVLAIEPFTALAIFSGAASMIFGVSSGNKMRRAREDEARVARENAARQADRILSEELPQMGASQRAAWAKSGFQTEGTPFAMMMDTARRMTRDAADIRRTGNVQADYISRMGRVERNQAIFGGIMGAAGAGMNLAGQNQALAAQRGTAPSGVTVPNVDANFFMPGRG